LFDAGAKAGVSIETRVRRQGTSGLFRIKVLEGAES
jgi:hypothetical protein